MDIDKLKALHEAATPGPWYWGAGHGSIRADKPHRLGKFETRVAATHDGNAESRDIDYELIMVLRNAVPEIIAQSERLARYEMALLGIVKLSIDQENHRLYPDDAMGWESAFDDAIHIARTSLGEDQ